ncbi:MAG: GAF domain-containing protein [Bdellovibrionota bacterium]
MSEATVEKLNQRETININSFIDLEKIFENYPYNEYEFKRPANGVITLYRDGLTKFFICDEVWQNTTKVKTYINHTKTPGISIICVGTVKELQTLPSEMQSENIQQICLPVSEDSLSTSIRCIHNFQKLVDHAETEKRLIEKASQEVKYVLSISRELNGERNIKKLLNLILFKAREITNADAGSIYTTEIPGKNVKEGKLHFRFTQNDSIKQNLNEFELQISDQSIVGSAVIHNTTINIPDLYKLNEDSTMNPFGARHDRSWDRRLGYESHSMLTIPMFDISHSVVGVIQLINRKIDPHKKLKEPADFTDNIAEFSQTDIEYAEIVAQQAGIALENANMHEEIQKLFDGFVNASVTAIEQRDPTTSGHSHRVAALTIGLADIVSRTSTGGI